MGVGVEQTWMVGEKLCGCKARHSHSSGSPERIHEHVAKL